MSNYQNTKIFTLEGIKHNNLVSCGLVHYLVLPANKTVCTNHIYPLEISKQFWHCY